MGHNACKGTTTDKERKSLLACQLFAHLTTLRPTTRMTTFSAPLQASAASDSLLLTTPLPTDLDRCPFPVVLFHLFREEDGHRLCMGNWNSSQIIEFDQTIYPNNSVQACAKKSSRSEQALGQQG